MVYSLFSNCKIVSGHKTSVIYDLYRLRYKKIPNMLAELLLQYNHKDVVDYEVEVGEGFSSLIEMLGGEDYLLISENKLSTEFSEWDEDFSYPGHISTANVHFSNTQNYNVKSATEKISGLGSTTINFHVKEMEFEIAIDIIIESITNRSFETVSVFYYGKINLTLDLAEKIRQSKRIASIYAEEIGNSDLRDKMPHCNLFDNFSFSTKISKNDFIINPLFFNEALKHNVYSHQRIEINELGEINF
ncbi:MAG: hypothetical protein ACI8ZM_001318 [Crocinitomix sp.]|jgi:hypothetical protein